MNVSTAQIDRFGHGRTIGYKTLTNQDSQPYLFIGYGPHLELGVYLHADYMNVAVGEGHSKLRPYLIPQVEALPGCHPASDDRDRNRKFLYAEVDCDQVLTDLAAYVDAHPLPATDVDHRLAKRAQRAY
jgi:hypothetical protein